MNKPVKTQNKRSVRLLVEFERDEYRSVLVHLADELERARTTEGQLRSALAAVMLHQHEPVHVS